MRNVVLLLLAIALVLAACGDSDNGAGESDQADEIYGEWTTSDGNQWSYKDDGTWTFTLAGGADPAAWGTYTFDGTQLSYTAEKSYSCGDGSTAVYDISFTDSDTMVLGLVDDECAPRAGDATGGPFVRATP